MQQALQNINTVEQNTAISAPILKWAGGKTQLLKTLNQHYPKELLNGKIDTYIEPFIGGGAVFFNIISNFKIKKAYLFDINPELIILYNSLKLDVDSVIYELSKLENKYLAQNSEDDRKAIFYAVRLEYNSKIDIVHNNIKDNVFNAYRSAMTIFLNRVCFNGLFRVNSKGEFNVPHGSYKNPRIVFEDKLRSASRALQIATIEMADFSECKKYLSERTFIYYDPPYRPINKTSQFNSYSKESFDDIEQIRLAGFFEKLNSFNVYQLLSNSDPSNYVEDLFFDKLYERFTISRVNAKRIINSKASNRGILKEILVKNYP